MIVETKRGTNAFGKKNPLKFETLLNTLLKVFFLLTLKKYTILEMRIVCLIANCA